MHYFKKQTTIQLVFLVVLLMSISAFAMAANDSNQPGYVDLSFIDIPDDAESFQDIDLSLVLKDVAREAKKNDDLAIAELLSMVHSLRLRSFSVDSNSEKMAKKAVKKISERLEKDGWDTLMRFKDSDELTTISTMYHNDNMVGLTVVVFSPEDEAMFINIVGDLDLGRLMRLASQLDSHDLEGYLEQFGDESGLHLE